MVISGKNLTMNFNVNALAGAPYTMRSGFDTNGDLIYNDRPTGIGRNTLRGQGQRTFNMFLSYSLALGQRPDGSSGGIVVTRRGEEGVLNNVQMSAPDDARFHIVFTLQALNLTNHANYTNYVGTQTSQLFGLPLTVNNMRKIEFLMNFQF